MKTYIPHIILALVIVILGGALYYSNEENKEILAENERVSSELLKTSKEHASTTAMLSQAIESLESDLALTLGENEEKDKRLEDTISVLQGVRGNLETTQIERDQLQNDLKAEEAKIGILSEQVSSITNVVSQIDKLSKTDKELLQKYSKVYFLNEHYIPENLVLIEDEYVYNTEKRYWFHRDAYAHLIQMMDAAYAEGVDMSVVSAYRSFYAQEGLKNSYEVVYGKGANIFSADQGYSEHQLGTTVDFTDSDVGASFEGFDSTRAYFWLLQHAYKYGFTMSYPPNNEYYVFEPWHWRFVGIDLATKLRNEGKYFYDEDQRILSSYLLSIFNPLVLEK